MPISGMRLGRYRREQTIGNGGHAVVYTARDCVNGQKVVVKDYDFGKDGSERTDYYKQRFRQEAEMLGELSEFNHPNIVKMFDYFDTGKHGYIILEYIDGEPLEQRASKTRLREQDAVSIGLQSSDFLSHLHGKKDPIVYGDLKPKNTLLLPNGRAVFIDYDLSRHLSKRITDKLGTPGYDAPEISRLEKGTEADMYSLAWTLYYALTSKAPDERLDQREEQRKRMDVDLYNISPRFLKLLQRTTSERTSERCTASEMLEEFMKLYDPRQCNLLILDNRRKGFSIGPFTISFG